MASPVPDLRILKRKMIFKDPPLCPYLHACILKGCPFKHQRTLLRPALRMPRPIRHNLCANDDCHAQALPGRFCCNPCEREYSGGPRLFKPCPAHEGACKVIAGSRHCSDCPGEENILEHEHESRQDSVTSATSSKLRKVSGKIWWTLHGVVLPMSYTVHQPESDSFACIVVLPDGFPTCSLWL